MSLPTTSDLEKPNTCEKISDDVVDNVDGGDDDDVSGDDADGDDNVDLLCSLVDPGDLVVAVGHLDDVPHIVQRSE